MTLAIAHNHSARGALAHRLRSCCEILLAAALILMPAKTWAQSSQPALTTVKDTVFRPDGSLASGSVVISWNSFQTQDSKPVFGGSKTLALNNGALLVALTPNVGATPAGTSYTVRYYQSGAVFAEEFWVVPTSSPTPAPTQPTVTHMGGTGSTTYCYWISASLPPNETNLSSGGCTSQGHSSLSSSNFNRVSWSAVPGATSYRIFKTTSPTPPVGSGSFQAGTTTLTTFDDTTNFLQTVTIPEINTTDPRTLQQVRVTVPPTLELTFSPSQVSGTAIVAAPSATQSIVAPVAGGVPLEVKGKSGNNSNALNIYDNAATPVLQSYFNSAGDARFKDLNNVRFADQFAGADAGAKINAAIADLGPFGGTVDARGFEGAQAINDDILVGTTTKPVTLLLGGAIFTLAPTKSILFFPGSQLIGLGPDASEFHYSGSGTVIKASNPAGTFQHTLIDGIAVVQTGAAQGTGINMDGLWSSVVRNVYVQGFNYGIDLNGVSGIYNTVITKNNLVNNTVGIRATASVNRNEISNNRVLGSNVGIQLASVPRDTMVTGNDVEGMSGSNPIGIDVAGNENNIIGNWLEEHVIASFIGVKVAGNYNHVSGNTYAISGGGTSVSVAANPTTHTILEPSLLRRELGPTSIWGNATLDNNTDLPLTLTLDAGTTARQSNYIDFKDRGTSKWQMGTLAAPATFFLYDGARNRLRMDEGGDNVIVGGSTSAVNYFTDSAGVVRFQVRGDTDEVRFGNAGDTNLYRSAANTLKTDDTLVAGVAFQSAASDPADTGVVRLGNDDAISAEASPAGTDGTLKYNSANHWESSSPLSLDGATPDANKAVITTADPTGTRTFTLPDANSNPVQPFACSGTDKVSAISSAGVITCTADQGGAGGGGGDNLRVEDGDNAGTYTAMNDADFDDSGDIDFQRTADAPDSISGVVRPNSVALTADTTGNYVGSVADGTGIDGEASGEGAAYTPTLDLTEINSHTFGDNSAATLMQTLDPTGATNPAWSYSNGVANLSSGTLQQGGTAVALQSVSVTAGNGLIGGGDISTNRTFDIAVTAPIEISGDAVACSTCTTAANTQTLTNKTLDAEGTGNVLLLPQKIEFQAAGCDGTTAAAGFDLPTSNAPAKNCQGTSPHRFGTLDFADGGSALTSSVRYLLPSDWTATGGVDIRFIWSSASTSTSSLVWTVQTACAGDGEDTSNPTYNTLQTISDANNATASTRNSASLNGITITGCAAGETLYLKVGRDPNNGSDTLAATALLHSVEITIRRQI